MTVVIIGDWLLGCPGYHVPAEPTIRILRQTKVAPASLFRFIRGNLAHPGGQFIANTEDKRVIFTQLFNVVRGRVSRRPTRFWRPVSVWRTGPMRIPVLGFLLVAPVLPVRAQAPGLVGRWDLTFEVGQVRYPSWLEVVRDGDSLRGRFQGRFGHATPIATIGITGDRFQFVWPDEDNASAPVTRFEGTVLGANRLNGVMTPAQGARESFGGVRAPIQERFRTPRWGRPTDLLANGLRGWTIREPETKNGWRLDDGVLSNAPPSADLVSRQRFTDFRLHVEVNVPPKGNSGIYLRGRHEIQVQDDFGNPPHPRRMGGVYGQITPTSLPAKRAGEWQAFDITMVGRILTVRLNGITIIDQAEIPGITGGAIDSDEGAPGPVMLQGDHSGVRYRNIRIEPAVEEGGLVAAAVARAERDRFRAQVARDTAALGTLLDDDLVYVHSNALIENKARFIETIATGRIGYDSLVPVQMTHRVHGSTAVGNGRVHAVVRMNGQNLSVDLLFTTVLLHRNGRWRLVNWQSTLAQ